MVMVRTNALFHLIALITAGTLSCEGYSGVNVLCTGNSTSIWFVLVRMNFFALSILIHSFAAPAI
jgi:hypothetical protein